MSTPPLRLFLVGCPRSGTTILQSCIGAHPRVFTFRESRLMRTISGRRALAAKWGVASRAAPGQMRAIYAELGLDAALCRPHFWVRGYVRDFISAVDRACGAAGKDVWLEKTPDHVRHIPRLESLVRGARFIHILRNGAENVCSLMEVSRDPSWAAQPLAMEEALERWSFDVQISMACHGRPGHLVVRHADLVASPEMIIRRVDGFVGLEFDPLQLSGLCLDQIASPVETWKRGVSGGVRPPDPALRRDVLTLEQKERLREAVAPLQARIDALPPPMG